MCIFVVVLIGFVFELNGSCCRIHCHKLYLEIGVQSGTWLKDVNLYICNRAVVFHSQILFLISLFLISLFGFRSRSYRRESR